MYYAACKVNDGGEDGDPCGGTSSDKIGNTGSNICSGSGGLIESSNVVIHLRQTNCGQKWSNERCSATHLKLMTG